jgi:CRISPR-associated endonuclease Csn1
MFQQLKRTLSRPMAALPPRAGSSPEDRQPCACCEPDGRHGTYRTEALDALRPLFVSRAPQRRNGGAAHKDTIYASAGTIENGQRHAESAARQPDPEGPRQPDRPAPQRKLYAAIRAASGDPRRQGRQGLSAGNPLRKPDRDGNPTGPIVRTVTMVIDKLSGIPVRGGIAKNDSMLRVDVFTKGGKFHLVPVYVHHTVAKALPNRAIVAFKDEDEWTLIDDSFAFVSRCIRMIWYRVTLKKENRHLGYYAGCDRSTGAVNLWAHDRNHADRERRLDSWHRRKNRRRRRKFHVDTLGNIYPAPPETRVVWRSVMISRPAKLRREHFSLAIEQEETAFVPFEDIAVIVLNHREITLTHPVLSACAEYGIGLYATGTTTSPTGVPALPLSTRARRA